MLSFISVSFFCEIPLSSRLGLLLFPTHRLSQQKSQPGTAVIKKNKLNLNVSDLQSSVFLDFQGKGFRYPQHYLVALLNLPELFHLLPQL